jgi:5'-nucleotidase
MSPKVCYAFFFQRTHHLTTWPHRYTNAHMPLRRDGLNILIGNDDGINSSGLDMLAKYARRWGDVTVVAPEKQQSAQAKSMTFHKPLRVSETQTVSGIPAYACNASPADCMFIYHHFKGKPDAVLSGINGGDNTSIHSVLTSGTVAVALEAGLQNIPAFAFSMDVPEHVFFARDFSGDLEKAADLSIRIAQVFYRASPEFWSHVTFVNVNFPDHIHDKTRLKIAELETYKYTNYLIERVDPRGETYYWLWGNKRTDLHQEKDSYQVYVEKNITITPVSFVSESAVFEEAHMLISNITIQ